MNPRSLVRKTWMKQLGAVALAGAIASAFGCLTRPLSPSEPTTKDIFTAVVKQQAVDKVDLLFMVDNSSSMGDKQDLLAAAVPDLVTRLLLPNCVLKDNPSQTVPRQ